MYTELNTVLVIEYIALIMTGSSLVFPHCDRCPAQRDYSLVIELQAGSGGGGGGFGGAYQQNTNVAMTTRAWCKMDLFDSQGRLISGRWRIPLRLPPLRPNMSSVELNALPQVYIAIVYLMLSAICYSSFYIYS